jgi:hypothetical protein
MPRSFYIIIALFFSISGSAQPGTFVVRKSDSVAPRAQQINLLWYSMGTSGGSTRGVILDNIEARLVFRSKGHLFFGPEVEYYFAGDYESNFAVGFFAQRRYLLAVNTVVVVEGNYHFGTEQRFNEEGVARPYQNAGLGVGFDWWFWREWRCQIMLEYQINAIGLSLEENLTPLIRINWPIFTKK